MTISYNWLKSYINFNLSPEDLGVVLTNCGLEVESISKFESVKGGLKGVVVGKVISCEKHPDADKLKVTSVNTGSGEPLQIVCGAPNVAVGQTVLVATIGSTLYPTSGEPLVMKKAKIRGIESQGMICAEDELGISENHNGIMVLDEKFEAGMKAADVFGVEEDFVIEIGLTPNRTDAFSHIGVARDLAAALESGYQVPIQYCKPKVEDKLTNNKNLKATIQIEDKSACFRYSAVCLENVKVASSPQWLKNKLIAIGVKSINNVVDITNFVLHESGQPLHAFDFDKISNSKVVIRKAKAEEKFVTLDGIERNLHEEDLLICDEMKPMCIAGVFGGLESGVSDSTTKILIESAAFSPTSIRKTSQRHGLKTDASSHFEKGSDVDATLWALKRAALLMVEICGAEIASEVYDIYPETLKENIFDVTYKGIDKLAGIQWTPDFIKKTLQKTGIEIISESEIGLTLKVPHYKVDVAREADIVEELLRLFGYNSIPMPDGLKSNISFSPKPNINKEENKIAAYLSENGFNEIWTNSISKSTNNPEHDSIRVKLMNSQTSELDSLRTEMIFSGLEVILHNLNRKSQNLKFFEFGKTYSVINETYLQKRILALFLTGQISENNWITKKDNTDFFHLKNHIQQIINLYHVSQFSITDTEIDYLQFGLTYKTEETNIATFGMVKSSLLKKYGIKQDVWYAEINWDYLLERSNHTKISFRELPKYPQVQRDLSMIVDKAITYAQIENIAFMEGKKLLKEVSLFDVYMGDKMDSGKKSYAIRYTFLDESKTLTDQDIEKLISKMMKKYESELNAVIRTS